ncbi:MAG: type II toxin-antitoxin system RatA family toxin [Natronosporangium sp.]
MPVVTASVEVPGAAAERVWAVVSDGERMPARSDQVVQVRRHPDRAGQPPRASWTVLLNGSRVSWVQQETAQPPYQLAFTQLTGDLAELSGRWRIHLTPAGVRLELRLAFQLGIDGLARLFDPIWTQALQAYADQLVPALARAATSTEEAHG